MTFKAETQPFYLLSLIHFMLHLMEVSLNAAMSVASSEVRSVLEIANRKAGLIVSDVTLTE